MAGSAAQDREGEPREEKLSLVRNLASVANSALSIEFPLGAGYHYYASFPFFAKATSDASERLKGLLAGLFREAEIAEGDFSLQDIHNSLVPCLDNLLDRVDEALQEKDKPGREKRQKGVPFHAKSIARPQDSFATPVDNSNSPWIPPPPLGSEGQETEPGKHPLEQRIRDMEAPKQVLEIPQILREMPAPMDRTEGAFIDTTEALNSLAKDLRNQKEIAVDLEANQYRSFQGITCLMQISTRFQDYVVDAIALRSQLRHFLAPIFEDPSIIKVLHGADSDVTWLQRIVVFNPHWSREGNQNERRDFGMYLIGLFDTGQAARVLEMEKYSLAHVLEHFCGVKPDKRFQLADWRIRPLTGDMLRYARQDTHYLLYIYDRLRQDLAEAGKLNDAVERSKQVSLRVYEKEVFNESDFWSFYDRYATTYGELSPPQLAVFAELYRWRDQKAREIDESKGYVLPKAALFRLAKRMPCGVNELATVSRGEVPVVMEQAEEVASLIAAGRARGKPPARPSASNEIASESYETRTQDSDRAMAERDITEQLLWVESSGLTHDVVMKKGAGASPFVTAFFEPVDSTANNRNNNTRNNEAWQRAINSRLAKYRPESGAFFEGLDAEKASAGSQKPQDRADDQRSDATRAKAAEMEAGQGDERERPMESHGADANPVTHVEEGPGIGTEFIPLEGSRADQNKRKEREDDDEEEDVEGEEEEGEGERGAEELPLPLIDKFAQRKSKQSEGSTAVGQGPPAGKDSSINKKKNNKSKKRQKAAEQPEQPFDFSNARKQAEESGAFRRSQGSFGAGTGQGQSSSVSQMQAPFSAPPPKSRAYVRSGNKSRTQ